MAATDDRPQVAEDSTDAKLRRLEALRDEAMALARSLADGPTFAHAMTKRQLDAEWHVSIDEAIEAEAQAQALCMLTQDFKRAFDAFAAKRTPRFEGD